MMRILLSAVEGLLLHVAYWLMTGVVSLLALSHHVVCTSVPKNFFVSWCRVSCLEAVSLS